MLPKASIAIIIVSHRNNLEVISQLEHLDSFPPDAFALAVVVANGLNARECAELREATRHLLPSRLRLVAGEDNPGYFGGARIGLENLSHLSVQPSWIIVANDDIRFAPDFFAALATAPNTSALAALAPNITVQSTTIRQNPLYATKPSRWRIRCLLTIHSSRLLMLLHMAIRSVRRQKTHPRRDFLSESIYAAHGACLVFSSNYFARGGTLNYPCFLYGEEFFVAETARRLGLSILTAPNLCVDHREHSSTGRLPSKSVARFMRESLSFILKNHYS